MFFTTINRNVFFFKALGDQGVQDKQDDLF